MDKNKNEKACLLKKTSIGGQALIEGIMMRGPKKSAMAVRDPEGNIVVEEWQNTAQKRPKFCKWPIIRGVFGFIDSMLTGYKALMRSAEIAIDEEEEKAKKAKKEKKTKKSKAQSPSDEVAQKETKKDKKSTDKFFGAAMGLASVLGTVLAIALFIILPNFIYTWLENIIPFLPLNNAALNSLVKSAFEGLLKIAVLVAYMALVTLMKDIRRTFMYHGAEHKTIFCYEHGLELTVENVKKQSRFHPRCGTSFLILMLLVSMLISFFIDPIFILATGKNVEELKGLYTLLRSAIKLLLLPINMGVGYELIKFAGKHDNLLTRIISAPGMWLQHITVLEPEDDMIDCAITAFKKVIPEEEQPKEEQQ